MWYRITKVRYTVSTLQRRMATEQNVLVTMLQLDRLMTTICTATLIPLLLTSLAVLLSIINAKARPTQETFI